MTKAYGFNPQAAQAGLWSTDPLWQAEVSNNSLTTTATSYHYLHTDHLGTPMLATDKAGQTSWKGISEAFGQTRVDNGSQIEMNLRFPGQYWDSETNSHYNYFRDYQPHKGRYVQNDPIGLEGGINTYLYANAAPTIYTDSEGLTPAGIAIGIGIRVIGGRAAVGAIGAGARALLGPTIGGIAACVLAGVCSVSDSDSCPHEKNCVAVRNSILSTCSSLTGAKKVRCVAAAEESYQQCISQR